MEFPDRQACVSLDRSKASVLLSAEANWKNDLEHGGKAGADLPARSNADSSLRASGKSALQVIFFPGRVREGQKFSKVKSCPTAHSDVPCVKPTRILGPDTCWHTPCIHTIRAQLLTKTLLRTQLGSTRDVLQATHAFTRLPTAS